MKKLILFIILFWSPIIIKAYENYDINNYLIDATVQKNGDLQIKELIELEGNFKGFTRDIVFKNNDFNTMDKEIQSDIYNAKSISDLKIRAKLAEDNNITFKTFDEIFKSLDRVYYEEDSKNGSYLESSTQNGKRIKMFYEGNNQTIIYYLSYVIKSSVVIHEDIAELYYLFIPDNIDHIINNLQIKLTILDDNINIFNVWGHGDITRTIAPVQNNTMLITLKSLNKDTSFDVRAIFDKDWLIDTSYLNKTKETSKDKIIEEETLRAKQDILKREKYQKIFNIIKTMTIILIIFISSWWIYVYFKYKKEYKRKFKNKYYYQVNDKYDVEVVEYLLEHNVSERALASSLLNLIMKKNINVKIKKDGKTKEYQFTLINQNNISNTEEVLIDLLFEVVGDKNKVTSKQLLNIYSNEDISEAYINKYNSYLNCVKKDAEKNNFYEKNGVPLVSSIFILLGVFIYISADLYYHIEFNWIYLVLIEAIAFMIYSLMVKRRSREGNEEYYKWLSFKNTCLDIKELKENITTKEQIEEYMIYSLVLGINKELENNFLKIYGKDSSKLSFGNNITEDIYSLFKKTNENIKKRK